MKTLEEYRRFLKIKGYTFVMIEQMDDQFYWVFHKKDIVSVCLKTTIESEDSDVINAYISGDFYIPDENRDYSDGITLAGKDLEFFVIAGNYIN